MMDSPRLLPCLVMLALLASVSNSFAQITIVSKVAEGAVLTPSENTAAFDIELKPGNPHAMLVVGLSYATPPGGEHVRFAGTVTGPDGTVVPLKETVITPHLGPDKRGMGRLYAMSLDDPGGYRVQFRMENNDKLARVALLGIILANVDPQVADTAYSDPAVEDKLGTTLKVQAKENDRIVALLARSGRGKPLECNGWEPLLYVQAAEKAALNGALMLLPVESGGEQSVSWTWKAPYSRSASCAIVLQPAAEGASE